MIFILHQYLIKWFCLLNAQDEALSENILIYIL